jgi:LysM repeat protein
VPAAPLGVILGDATGALIATDVTPGSVSVVGVAATPVPATATAPAAPTATAPVPQPTATPPVLLPTATAIAIGPQPTATLPGPVPLLGNHTVKYGESLFCIGRAYTVSPWAIAQANGIGWPYAIYPNQVLNIPNSPWVNPPYGPVCQRQFGPAPLPTVAPSPLPTPVSTSAPSGCRATYAVVWGDTLSRIAFRFNSTVYLIAQANHIWNINLIYAGQRLCIP